MDAVVLPANEQLKMGSGASAAIFHAAGVTQLAKRCAELKHCNVGSAVVTEAFNLDAQAIIHACVPKWRGGNHNEYELLSTAYLCSLELADQMQLQSIAFPLLCAGNNHFNKEAAFSIAVDSISKYESKNIKQAFLVLYDDELLSVAKSLGYLVLEGSPKNIKNSNMDKLSEDLRKLMQKAMDKLKEPEVQKKIAQIAVLVVPIILKKCHVPDSVVSTVEQILNIWNGDKA